MFLNISKLDPSKRIGDLSTKEFESLRTALERIEGWEIGVEKHIEKWVITGTHLKHHVIWEYRIKKSNKEMWVSKNVAIKFAIEGRLRAVIVHLKYGSSYLRPKFHEKAFREMAC